ncbi:hypothetical protein B0H19DRAFT_692233 [Mycena capillaripes]|nr:hypothetical protein B0H19DRAFT_692233 [Mycena capillaripes]
MMLCSVRCLQRLGLLRGRATRVNRRNRLHPTDCAVPVSSHQPVYIPSYLLPLFMNWIPESAPNYLPDEVLAIILKLVADIPVPTSARTPPAPVAASRVNRQWRVVALASPELWTNIRISHRSRSFHWAALFVKRSLSRPLDISVNLESYGIDEEGCGYEVPIPLNKALAIVGPHIGRWRTFALRAFFAQIEQFCAFVAQSAAAARLEFTHFSCVDYRMDLPPLAGLFPSESFCALRITTALMPDDLVAFRALHTLDLNLRHSFDRIHSPAFREVVGPSSSLTTLIIRGFWPKDQSGLEPIDCSTIRFFALSVSRANYRYLDADEMEGEGIVQSLTNIFHLPNLEHLELLGWFSGSRAENRHIRSRVREDWEVPLFPYLRTLRLEDMAFSRRGLAFIQSFSRNITALLLVCTRRNHHLLAWPGAWPVLRALTIEGSDGAVDPRWVAPFVAMRAARGAPISDMTLSLWLETITPAVVASTPAPVIHLQRSGPSPALMDDVYGPGFYVDEFDMRVANFAHVELPERQKCRCCGIDWFVIPDWKQELDLERLEEEIENEFRKTGEIARSKRMWRELRRGAWRGSKRNSEKWRGSRVYKTRSYDFSEDFSVA